VLRNELDKCGIRFIEREVTFLGRGGQRVDDAFVCREVVAFQQQPEEAFHLRDRFQQFVSGISFEQQDLGILQGVDIVRGAGPAQETGQVGNPPVFDGELQNMFFPLMIDGVLAKTALVNKGKMSAHIAFLQKELSFLNLLWSEELAAQVQFLLAEADSLLNMLMKQIGHVQSRVNFPGMTPC